MARCPPKDFGKSRNQRTQYRLQSCRTHFSVSPGSPLSVGIINTRIIRVISICYKVSFKIRESFDELLSMKKVLSESCRRIETHIDVVVEFLEVQISVAFDLYFDEEFIEF